MKYRKKPVTIEALRWDSTAADAATIINWILQKGGHATYHCDGVCREELHKIQIRTLEGPISASAGDYVIRGVQGEFYPCKPDIFLATYDEVTA